MTSANAASLGSAATELRHMVSASSFGDAAQFGHDARHAHHFRRRIAGLVLLAELVVGKPGGSDIGRVGFQHDRLDRQFGGQAADLPRAGKRHVAAESELHAVGHVVVRLIVTAVERMGDTLPHARATQLRQDLVLRLAHVQQHRQVEVARDLQLLRVQPGLMGGVEPRHEEVEPDFANGNEARVVDRRRHLAAQFIEIGLPGGPRVQRVDAERIDAAWVGCASPRTTSKFATATAGNTMPVTPAAAAASVTSARSASNSLASRWQCVSIHMAGAKEAKEVPGWLPALNALDADAVAQPQTRSQRPARSSRA
jgi:hypothetical protein